MTLRDAILRLEQHAEGRRAARETLRAATDAIEKHLCATLRVGDEVTVADRRYTLVRQKSNVGAARFIAVSRLGCEDCYPGSCAHRTQWLELGYLQSGLGAYLHGDFHSPLASVTDTERAHFAIHADEILSAFANQLNDDRERFADAAAAARGAS